MAGQGWMVAQAGAEQGTAADALQRPLRCRFQARLSAGVSRRKYGIRVHIRAQFDIESKSEAGTSVPIPGRYCHGDH
jgi:hypothetical protein